MNSQKWSVEVEQGGYVWWAEVRAASADEARGAVNRSYGDAHIRAVSLVKEEPWIDLLKGGRQ